MTEKYVWIVVIGMALANFALRFIPIALLSQLKLPRPIERWLSFIPVSVMSALVVGEVLRPDGVWLPPLSNPYLFAAIPTALVYYKWRSFLGTTVAGILFFLVFRALLG
ncbi:MAG: branched-chain amino acid ABC transporter [Actinobacteria bacterium HGW-Actinobacteria-6]|nr:MAG: branched-chain amino acid ABC transporter [Actinobacteria bacterium HGW-Actinobacteria-6]